MITKVNVSELKPHPRNKEFFDDITGEKWDEFLESIKTHGVIEPIIITPKKVIVSGHQRVKACKELGIEEVDCVTKYYNSDDEILRDLLESNIRQRGDIGGSAQKIGRRIKELERLYGVRQGSGGKAKWTSETQKDIASELGIGESQYKRYKKLADMVPELSEAVDTGRVTQSAALAMMKQLSEDEQIDLLSHLDATKKYTQKETDGLIAEIKKLNEQPPKVIEKLVEKEPDDYQQIKREVTNTKIELQKAQNNAKGWQEDYERERDSLAKERAELSTVKDKLKSYEEADAGNSRKKRQIDAGEIFDARVTKFIEDVAGYVWLTDEITELPEKDQKQFIRSVEKVKDWANQMDYNIKQKLEEEK